MAAVLPLLGLLAAGGTTYGVKKGLENRKMKKRMAGENSRLFVDEYGVIRTLPGALNQHDLKLDTSGGAAAPLLDPTQGGQLVAPGSFYQTQRLLGLQQAGD